MHAGTGERPRELRWYHAAGFLFGDWGTSRLYVLGIAFAASGHASFWYVAAMCVLMALVGLAYSVICKHYPDGGGVYSAAKQRSRELAVVGALMLVADYTVTAALSAYEGFRYVFPSHWPVSYSLLAAVVSILFMGALNVVGPRRVGLLAAFVAFLSAISYLIIGFCGIGWGGHATMSLPHEPLGTEWSHFVNVILALSGVEAIANMTGVMAEPVGKNARRAIMAVLAEVIVMNLIFAYAMNALPMQTVDLSHGGESVIGYTLQGSSYDDAHDHMVKILAEHYVGAGFAWFSSICFGLLLLSAANTAIGGMISVQYLLGRDKELPGAFTWLNRFGVPWVGLVMAVVVPALVLLCVGSDSHTLDTLAGLYAIGVVGAIGINLGVSGTNKALDLSRVERAILLFTGVVIAGIEVTIAVEKPNALLFAVLIVGTGLAARFAARNEWRRVGVTVAGLIGGAALSVFIASPNAQAYSYAAVVAVSLLIAHFMPVPAPVVAPELAAERAVAAPKRLFDSAIRKVPLAMPRLLVPTRGGTKLMRFAADYARSKEAALFVLFVREVALAFRERGAPVASETTTLANDKEAQQIFAEAQEICKKANVPMVPLYAVHDSPAELILDHAATMGVDAVVMGVSKRGALWKALKGDVLQEVISYLPQSISLLIHA